MSDEREISLWELCIHGQAYMHRTAGVDCPGGKEHTYRWYWMDDWQEDVLVEVTNG